MKRYATLLLLAMAALLACVAISPLGAQEPPLCPGAVALRAQLQTFQTMRFYLMVPTHRTATSSHRPVVLHLRADGRIAVDNGSGSRDFWDGTTLWHDYPDASEPHPEPPEVRERWFTPLIAPLFQALRQDTVSWLARGPGYYGWEKRDNPVQYAELVHSTWTDQGYHVFLKFGGTPQRLDRLLVENDEGIKFNVRIYRTNLNPTLPNAAFTPAAPPQPVFFPEGCEWGWCEDSQPPGPTGG